MDEPKAPKITITQVRAMVHGMDYKIIGWAAYEWQQVRDSHTCLQWQEVEVAHSPYLSVLKDIVRKKYPGHTITVED
ncbi:MAG: hypothetical protein NPIRA04_03380 [Nitrospirales bacterium]|nr:MAG: hypothetical protein NPIRA04_03380 [Nitrospirales bacterium]